MAALLAGQEHLGRATTGARTPRPETQEAAAAAAGPGDPGTAPLRAAELEESAMLTRCLRLELPTMPEEEAALERC